MNHIVKKGEEALLSINLGSNPNDNANTGFSTIVDMVKAFASATDEAQHYSLPSFTKSTQISSTVYIQNDLKDEEVLTDTLQCAQQLYISWILAAVNLNNFIDGTNTRVKDALKVVASEEWINKLNQYHINTSDIIKGLENFVGTEAAEVSGLNNDITKDVKLPVGRTVELTIKGVNHKDSKVNVLVNLYPQFIPTTVAKTIVKLGKQELLRERWFKVRTGEYSFWKDFIFELNKSREIKRAIKDDKTGLLLTIINKQESAFFKWAQKLFSSMYNQISKNHTAVAQNIANSIYVYNKYDFDKWCKESNIKLNNPSSRDELMRRLAAMMIIVIDPDFRVVEMYYNGISNKGEFTYNQIASQSKSEKYDLSYIMQAFSKSNAPKF